MSTGDQSEYLRKKMAERRAHYEQGGEFMRSGFQKWAENERPARHGGAMKDPLARASMKAGKDILTRVKSMGEDMFARHYKGTARHIQGHDEESSSDEEGEEGVGHGGFFYMGDPVKATKEANTSYFGKLFGNAAPMGVMPHEDGKGYSGVGRLEEHGADLIAMGTKGKGRLDCVHYEEGEGTHVKKGKKKGGYLDTWADDGPYISAARKAAFKPAFDLLFNTGAYSGEKVKTGMFTSTDRCDPGDEGNLKLQLYNELSPYWDADDGAWLPGTNLQAAVDGILKRGVNGKPCPRKDGKGKPMKASLVKFVKDMESALRTTVGKPKKGKGLYDSWKPIPYAPYGWYVEKAGARKRPDPHKMDGWKTREEAQAAADELNKSWIHGWGKEGKRKGKGFKEGVDASVAAVADVGQAAKAGYEVYEKTSSGNVFSALDSAKGVLQAGLNAKANAERAAREFGAGRPRKGKTNSRAELVKKVMREQGLSLPQASKYVKEHGLYKGGQCYPKGANCDPSSW